MTAGSARLIGKQATIGTWSQFDLIDNLDGSVSPRARERAHRDGDNAGSKLIANRSTVGGWEEFDRIYD